MKMQIDPILMLRIPQFSFCAILADCWPELKQSIKLSSKEFYKLIEDISCEEIDTLPESVRHTIWKYFNRACYRATPYGAFAAVTTARLDRHNIVPMIVAKHQQLQRFIDWTNTGQGNAKFSDLIKTDALLFANSTYYFTEFDIRYVSRFDNRYELSDVPKDDLKIKILEACVHPVPISALCAQIPESGNWLMFVKILESMLDDQLLISQTQPNIIGDDYFQRMGPSDSKRGEEYVIAQRPLLQGTVDQEIFRHLPGLIEKLHQMLPSYRSPEQEQFIQRFVKKFGAQEVSLMVALDPELGVGYGDMDQSMLTSDLINQLIKNEKSSTEDADNPTFQLLLPKLITDEPGIIDFESLAIPSTTKNAPLPNSLPALCTVADGMIQLEHLGGCTATSLLGRFTLSNDPVWEQCRQIAFLEQQANPGVIFFDIAYLAGGVVDNVNRRKSVYDYQLSILSYDTSADPLTLNDLVLSVKGSELLIRSRRLNKRVVPRLASAYNYLLSDLPVFRLLCDLQHQGIHKNLYLRLRDRIADLRYYPRLQYKNIILSPAAWLIRLEDVSPGNKTVSPEFLKNYLEHQGISGFVRVGSTDQTLCINTRRKADLNELLRLLQKQKSFYIEETIVPQNAMIEDTDGKPYVSQVLLTLHHGQMIYRPAPPALLQERGTNVEKIIPPGDEWLYFEIFCHPIRADELLTGSIQGFLETHQDRIRRWFFIRYTDNGNHIRLRIRLRKAEESQQILTAFTSLIKEKLQVGIVSDFSVRTYRREIERYGMANILFAETHFHYDSRFALGVLQRLLSDEEKYLLCISLANAILEKEIFTQDEFLKMVTATSDAFNTEHSLDPERFKLLNVAWSKLSNVPVPALDNEVLKDLIAFRFSFVDTLYQYPITERGSIFNSLFHMHINRMFPAQQRTHEMIIYYYLLKEIRSFNRKNVINDHVGLLR